MTGAHPIVAGVTDFEVVDEIYTRLAYRDVVPLMTSVRRDEQQPLLWVRPFGGGTVVYDALGHDERSLGHPCQATIVRRPPPGSRARAAEPVDDLTHASHIGIIVPDLEQASADLSAMLGLSWAPAVEQVVVARSPQGRLETPVRLTWSHEGPPHLELLQAGEGTPWDCGGARRLHHVGYWVDDVAAAVEDLRGSGLTLELAGVGPGGDDIADFAYLMDQELRVEVLDRRRESRLARWFALADG